MRAKDVDQRFEFAKHDLASPDGRAGRGAALRLKKRAPATRPTRGLWILWNADGLTPGETRS
jgi:hypothetical protein